MGKMKALGSRHDDIVRTAQEIRAKFLRDYINPKTSYKWEVVCRAYVSGMTDRHLAQLIGFLIYANPDGTESKPSHQTIASLRGCSVRGSETTTAQLEDHGWLSSRRKKNAPSVRSVLIGKDFKPHAGVVQDYRTNESGISFEVVEPHGRALGTTPPCGLPLFFTQADCHKDSYYRGREDDAGSSNWADEVQP
jgi:hypothetical protein